MGFSMEESIDTLSSHFLLVRERYRGWISCGFSTMGQQNKILQKSTPTGVDIAVDLSQILLCDKSLAKSALIATITNES